MSKSNSSHQTPPRSWFITFEGGEGAGKTSLMNDVQSHLESQGRSVVRTREPGGTPFSEHIRTWLLSDHGLKLCDMSELLLFLAARAQHIDEVIAPALKKGQVVLCDRFNDSTIAYQGVARGLGAEFVKDLCLKICGPIVPNLTIYLDVDPVVGLARTKFAHKEHAGKGNLDRIESERLQFHQKVRQAFIDLSAAEPNRLHTIDANQPRRLVIESAKSLLNGLV